MHKLVRYKLKIMEMVAKEIEEFDMSFEPKSPTWFILARKARYEFYQRVYLELPNFIFSQEESEAILKEGKFLEMCWSVWNDMGGTLPEAMEIVAECLTQEIDFDALRQSRNNN